jgi:AmiR/NasT family two-component response regulator
MTEAPAPVRVLVADDDGEGRALLVTMLSSLGHHIVAEVGSGHDAVASAQAETPDAVLLDVHMPDGSGIEAAKEIAAMLPGTAVLLFTGDHTLRLSDREVVETSAITILAKPTPRKTLESALRLAVAKAQALNAARDAAAKAKQELEERKTVERAKGILMRRGVTEQVAYEIMRRQSQDKSMRMVDIARDILKTEPGYEERERKPPQA